MAAESLEISKHQGFAVATFRETSLLDPLAIQGMMGPLFSLVEQERCRKIVLDFSSVQLISSSMVGVVLALAGKARAIKGKVVIYGLKPRLREMLMMTKPDTKTIEFATTTGLYNSLGKNSSR